MRYVVTGANGMLGQELTALLSDREVLALSHSDLDITSPEAVAEVVQPGDILINCAAYNAVDAAETDVESAMLVNATGPEVLARAAAKVSAPLVHFSTDYVFDGNRTSPYLTETERSPLSAYGRSKAAGEIAVLRELPDTGFVIRTAWLYGRGGPNFAQNMLNLAQKRDRWDVVDNQFGQPTWSLDLAEQVLRVLDADIPAGVYHGTNGGKASWFEFAQAVLTEAGFDPQRISPIDSSAFDRPAPRPAYSVLSHDGWESVGLRPMRPWRDALHAAFQAGTFAV